MLYGGLFDIPSKKERISELTKISEQDTFWNDRTSAEETLKELNELKELTTSVEKIKNEIESNKELINLLEIEPDEEIYKELTVSVEKIKNETEELNLLLLLNGPYDKNNCIFI